MYLHVEIRERESQILLLRRYDLCEYAFVSIYRYVAV